MLLDEEGLSIGAFEPVLASVLGSAPGEEGSNVLARAIAAGRSRVALRDWLFCLADATGTHVRKRLIDGPGKSAAEFIELIEAGLDEVADSAGLPPLRLTSDCVTQEVRALLERAEVLARQHQRPRVDDVVLTLALLEVMDPELRELVQAWTSEEGLRALEVLLRGMLTAGTKVDIFESGQGNLIVRLFAPSGLRLCSRAAEDAQSLCVAKITSRHLLYTLLSDERSSLLRALEVRGIDVKKDLHARLSRELMPQKKRRGAALSIQRDTVFDAVVNILQRAFHRAREQGRDQISERDISLAFVDRQAVELERIAPSGGRLDVASIRQYLEATEPKEEEEDAKKFTIREIEDNIRTKIRGQEVAVQRVIPWVKRLRFDLPRDGRPAAVFLFLGPTGSGKTQLAKELAHYVFGDEEQLIFIEMGSFQTKESMSGLIGAPPGYVGYGEGALTNGLAAKSECVVLFDEIEKAHVQVFDTLLRFADEGMISDPAGPVRDGRKCIIVMTTNAGQTWLRGHLEANPGDREKPELLAQQLFSEAMKELQERGFRPEFLGRVDERITFLPFTRQVCRQIVDGVLDREAEKFLKLKGVTLEVPDRVRDFLAEKAYERSGDEGARGAPRAVNDYIVTPAIDILTSAEADAGALSATHLIASTVGLTEVELEVVR